MTTRGLYGYKGGSLISQTGTSNKGVFSNDEYLNIKARDELYKPVIPAISTAPTSIYIPSTFDDTNNIWEDYMGNNNTSANLGNPFKVTGQTPSNGSTSITEYVQGNTGDGLTFGHTKCSSGYTGFHVSRYNGTEQRIWASTSGNWLSGFWNGNAGVAFHEGWLTSNDKAGTNWVLSVDKYNYYAYYHSGGSGSATGGANTNTGSWGINVHSERSQWQVYGFWYYDTDLSLSDIDVVRATINDLVGVY